MTWQYHINAPSEDPTYGGTRPLTRVAVCTNPQPGDRREARILENGVPVSAHWFKGEAINEARDRAIAHGLDCFYVAGERRELPKKE